MADVATLVFDIDSSQARTAATDLAKVNDAAERASRGAENLNRTLRDQHGRFRSSVDVANQYGNEVQRLAAKYNPALNAVYKYQQAQLELNRAVMLGVLTQKQADAALAGVAAGMQRATTAANRYATGMKGVNNIQGSVGNQFAQLNDVVVTAWGGMNPALIGMQQGMQMVQGFAGQSLPQALNTLKGAFAQLLNPTTLLTVGLVAGAAALIQWGASAFTSSKDAGTLAEKMDALAAAADRLNAATRASQVPLSDMIKAYGAWAQSAQQVQDAMVKIETARLQVSLAQTNVEMSKQLSSVRNLVAEYEKYERIGKALDGVVGPIAAQGRTRATRGMADATAELSRQFGLTVDQARMLDVSLSLLSSNPGPEDTAVLMSTVVELLGAGAAAGAQINKELLDMAANTGNLALALQLLLGLGSGGTGVAPSPSPTPSRGGKSEYEKAKEEWDRLNEVTYQGLLDDLNILKWGYDQKLIAEAEYQARRRQLIALELGAEFERNSVQFQLELDSLNLQFEQKLIAEETYLMKRRQLQHDYYSGAISVDQNATAQTLSNMASDFAQMNQLAGGGYGKLLKAQQTFAAGAALINAYLAATQALADPTVPFWGKFAAYAKVLAAGIGAVNAIKGGGKGSSASTATAAAKAEPQRSVLVRLEGDEWLTGMAEQIMTEIYEQTGNGRVVVQRDYS